MKTSPLYETQVSADRDTITITRTRVPASSVRPPGMRKTPIVVGLLLEATLALILAGVLWHFTGAGIWATIGIVSVLTIGVVGLGVILAVARAFFAP